MPLVVRELVIRATVEQGASQAGAGGADVAPEKKTTRERQAVVAECVDQVLDILADREER